MYPKHMFVVSWPVLFFVSFCMGILGAYLAHRQARNPWVWFGVGFVFGFFGIFFLLSIPKKKDSAIALPPKPFIDGPVDRLWYYLDSTRKQIGPMSYPALTLAWKKGDLNEKTLVWHEALPDWCALQSFIKEL